MRNLALLLVLIFILTGAVSAVCNSGQIDINSATATELDKIIWVGPATAEKIIVARPFDSVDDLTRVSGIGEVKIADIKQQGLACTGGDDSKEDDKILQEEEDKEDITEKALENSESDSEFPENSNQTSIEKSKDLITLQTINLSPQNIKSDESSESSRDSYAFYGLVAFSVILGTLFLTRRRKYKSEFK